MRTYQGPRGHCLWIVISVFGLVLDYVTCSSSTNHLRLSHATLTGLEDTAAHVTCTANITDKPKTLKWMSHHGNNFAQKSSVMNSVKLIIPSLHRRDAGVYTCFLVTANGEEEKAELRILVRPKNHDGQTCKVSQFKCKYTNDCIFIKYRCDGKDDCGDRSDEDCSSDPCVNKFNCDNDRCVDFDKRCDHVNHCGDNSDEKACPGPFQRGDKAATTVDPASDDDDDGGYSLVKSTIYPVIASMIALVILISVVVILVFRAKMKRLRDRRMVCNPLNPMPMYGPDESRPPVPGEERYVEHQPFLPHPAQPFHQGPSIIFNVNNGVQYMSRYRYFMENPPPYSEAREPAEDGRGDREATGTDITPPPYSTLDRSAVELGQASSQHPNLVRGGDAALRNHQGLGLDGGGDLSNTIVVGNSSSAQVRPGDRNTNGNEEEGAGTGLSSSSSTRGSNSAVSPRARGTTRAADVSQSPSVSEGQAPAGERPREREFSRNQSSMPAANVGSTSNGSRGSEMNVDLHFLQNLLVSQNSRRLTEMLTTDSESGSNESGASSCSSSGEDGVCNNLATSSLHGSNNRDSIHEVETLRVRDANLPHQCDEFSHSTSCELNFSVGGQRNCGRIGNDVLPPPSGATSDIDIDNAVSVLPNSIHGEISPDTVHFESPHRVESGSQSISGNDTISSSNTAASSRSISNREVADEEEEDNDSSDNDALLLNESTPSVQSPVAAAGNDGASSALFQEVARIEERNRPKQGHLSVHKGQIVLHTGDGILAGQTLLPSGDQRSDSAPTSLSGEIIVKDGNIMLQIPLKKSLTPAGHVGFPCMENIGHDQRRSPTSSPSFSSTPRQHDRNNDANDASDKNSYSYSTSNEPQQSTSPRLPPPEDNNPPPPLPSPSRFGGDLNIRDGRLVLEPPRHTPSSQILAHLHDAYSHEENDSDDEACLLLAEERGEGGSTAALDPVVVNDKRNASAVGHRQPTPKCNSDIVLARGKK